MTMASSSHSEPSIKYYFYGQNVSLLCSKAVCHGFYSTGVHFWFVFNGSQCIHESLYAQIQPEVW